MDDRLALVHILDTATSQDPRQVSQAEESLKTLVAKPNFHAMLFDIFADRSISTQIRWMATITLKNGVEKYWKRSALHPIKLEEKELVRPRLFTMLDESNPLVAMQYCLIVSKIARWEFPRVWPGFVDEILTHIQTIASDQTSPAVRRSTMEHNALYILHLFIKTLSARTLALERQALRQATPHIFSVLASIYADRIAQFHTIMVHNDGKIEGNTAFFEQTYPLLKSIRYCIKVLRRLWVFGYENIENADEVAQNFYMTSIGHQKGFFDVFRPLALSSSHVPDDYQLVLRKIVLLYGKMYLDFQKYHAVRFITVPCVKQMLQWYWQQISAEGPRLMAPIDDPDSAQEPVLEPLLIQGLELYKNVVKNFFYTANDNGEMDDEVKSCRQVIDGDILTPEFVGKMAELLMYYYIPLKPKDLERWQDDPEGWLADEESDYWNFDVRRCAEHLFIDLVNQKRGQVAPVLTNLVMQPENIANGTLSLTEQHYQREGCYAALGLCANDLYDYVDFCQWLKAHHIPDSPMDIAKWRVAWLVGKWVVVKFPVKERSSAYELLLHLAQTNGSLVVQIEALSSLMRCVDDWDFDPEQFAPYLQATFEVIARMLNKVDMPESRMRIVNFLSSIVQRMQREIVPYAESMVQLIPSLWQSAAGENMYQISIMVLVTRVIEALGSQSTNLQSFTAPLVRYSTDPNNPAHVYLIEDGIELWLTLIRNATVLDSTVIELLQLLPQLLQYSTETLRKVLKVVEGYMLIDGAGVFQHSGPPIIDALHSLVTDTTLAVRAIAAGYSTLNIIVQCVPPEIGGQAIIDSGIMWTAFKFVLEKKEAALALVHHAIFLSRVAVHYPQLFREFIMSQTVEAAGTFTQNWIELFDDTGNVAQRRLFALSFAVAIATTNDGVLKELPLMMPLWNDIMSDTGASLVYFSDVDDDMPDDYGEVMVAENARRRKLLGADPAHKFDIKHVLSDSMKECERLNGADRFHHIIAQVDARDLEDFKNQLN
ncbi:hypothetical protein LPJ79_005719 [Coemansia sp. RSA 1821]|nr:hypothetical protein LPJ68_005656 [Coemansia sp. RSA 1086]KAJ1746731.1 hypothetical protein LPJ79_005719 [Coemansia sp. RSA 1821]